MEMALKHKVKLEMQEKRSQKEGLPTSGSSDPWLLYIHGKRGSKHSLYKISQGTGIVRSIHPMRRKVVHTSSHSWLLLHNISSRHCYLFNPVSMDKIELPDLKDFAYNICLLSSPPTDINCTVLFISDSTPQGYNTTAFKCCRPNIDGANDQWTEGDHYFDGQRIDHAVSFQGRIIGIDSIGRIFSFLYVEPATLHTTTIEMRSDVPLPLPAEYDIVKKILFECRGVLYVVRLILWDELDPYVVQDLEVYMETHIEGDDRLVWEKVDSIGDDVALFFLVQIARFRLWGKMQDWQVESFKPVDLVGQLHQVERMHLNPVLHRRLHPLQRWVH